MKYYFPTFLSSPDVTEDISPDLIFTTNSGKNALRVTLRSFGMAPGSKVAIPAYVCPAVQEAVREEGLTPILLDLKSDSAFWTDYSHIPLEKMHAVILVHLYGFLHPDTGSITAFCKKNNIMLIHDAAQSFGIDESKLQGGPIIYSFGPGKSTTAACGGWIKGIAKEKYDEAIKDAKPGQFCNARADLFLKSRILNYNFTFGDKVKKILVGNFKPDESIRPMCKYQLRTASEVISKLAGVAAKRKENHRILSTSINQENKLIPSYENEHGQFFKLVLWVKTGIEGFKNYLSQNHVPFFCLFDKKPNTGPTNFSAAANQFIEISTEACIPRTEIDRIANVLRNYK